LRTIIKHANRRLYDARERRTVTLLEVSDLVTGGESISVVDKASGEDITAVTLLQSLLERLRRGSTGSLEAHEVDRLVAELRAAMGLRRGAAEPREPGMEAGLGTGAGTAGRPA
jgi:polyhydroxyalkanoate synthesis regulator protein